MSGDLPAEATGEFGAAPDYQPAVDGHIDVKEEGNRLFSLGDFEDALKKYDICIRSIHTLYQKADYPEEELTEVREKEVAVMNNKVLCYLRMRNWHKVIETCDKVLGLSPGNEKALYRKSKALFHMGNYEKSITVLNRVRELHPKNIEAENLLLRVKAEKKSYLRRSLEMAKAMTADLGSTVQDSTKDKILGFFRYIYRFVSSTCPKRMKGLATSNNFLKNVKLP
eukprot:GHVP01034549.1.p1 GENE.GHVP01034549.1~~GHVP01034549.1.p1  ORF type:complete len:240 (+),score=36.39 GHVP01034549.1:48-722(+)